MQFKCTPGAPKLSFSMLCIIGNEKDPPPWHVDLTPKTVKASGTQYSAISGCIEK